MVGSLIGLPFRLSTRCAGLALRGVTEVALRSLSLAGGLADALSRPASPGMDVYGSARDRGHADPASRPAPGAGSPSRPVAVPPPPEPIPRPRVEPRPKRAAPPESPEAAHVSEGLELVESVAEAGAEDGAGAEISVAEPWEGYRQMKAADVIDRISGASAAELAAVELYETNGKRRRTVLSAIERELRRASGP